MIDKQKLESAMEFAREHGLPWIEIDGVKMPVTPVQPPQIEISEEAMKAIYNPVPEFDDEDVLYWATPYYDELQEKKKLKLEQLKIKEDLNG